MPKEVFLSYSSKDRPTAEAAREALERAGLFCWMAPRDVQPGVEYGEAIIDGINGARVMVLIFSAAANASPQIRREVERAVHKGVPIIPVRIEDVFPSRSLEYFLSSPHWLDAIGPFEPNLPLLSEAVKAMLRRVAEGTVSRAAPPRRLFTRKAVPVPVQVQETMPIAGLVPPPRLSRSVILPPRLPPGAAPAPAKAAPAAPVLKPATAAPAPAKAAAGVPIGLVALGIGLAVAAIAAVIALRSANPGAAEGRPPAPAPAPTRPAARPAPTAIEAAEQPAARERTYECREGVRFAVWPETASVSINGKRVGTAAQWSDRGGGRVYTFARPGAYQVRLSQKGFATATLRVVVRSGASRDVADVRMDLKRLS